METRPALRLTQQHLAQLTAYCAVYRSYLWQSLMPTPERNQAVREVQALQARIEKANETGLAEVELSLTEGERNTIKQIFTGATQFYGAMPASEQRIQQLAEVTTFRVLVERMLRQAPPS
jgi:hypothetical protein